MNTSQTSQDKESQGLEAISRIATHQQAEQRRREAQSVLERKLPEWILEIVQTEVIYTISPRMLPLKQASFPDFMRMLKEKYFLHFEPPSFGSIFSTDAMSEEELGSKLMLESESRALQFTNGRFQKARNDFSIIRSVTINNETIQVSVEGISEIADLVVADVAEMIWASTGVQKGWDEIKKGIQLIGYGTATLVDLGFPCEDFLSSKLTTFIKTQMLDGTKFACAMGRQSTRHGFRTSPSLTAIFAVDDLNLNFYLFDNVTGRSETVKFRFSVTTKDAVGTGRIVVISELPFERHVECLRELIDTMRQN